MDFLAFRQKTNNNLKKNRKTMNTISKMAVTLFVVCIGVSAYAQQTDSLKNERFSIHAQTTIIDQKKLAFRVPYSGQNSLLPQAESQTSITSTLYLGLRLWQGGSVYINPELAGGSGLSQVLGIADETNGETPRIANPAPSISIARLFYQQFFALSKEKTSLLSDFNQLGGYIPTKYISLIIGEISIGDYFDDNKYSHDPRTQFMTWSLMDAGAWDYPADTHGYTPSIVIEYITPKNELRYGFSLMPKIANGMDMNWNIAKASAQTLEYTHRYKINGLDGAIKILGFFNTANMGNYLQSIALNPTAPNIESTRKNGNTKYGFAINAEQALTNNLGCFLRGSWNDGNNETWAFTEIDHSFSAGLSLTGASWKRNGDNIGLAYVTSGISKAHREYLADGGYGFMLGDGKLNYGWEHLTELYYSAELVKNNIYLTGAYQFLLNPGYNRDRKGPVNIFSVRLHVRI
jgi:high affinity Mn2+ porin